MTTVCGEYKDATAYDADDRGYFRFVIVDEMKETEIYFRYCPGDKVSTLQFQIQQLHPHRKRGRRTSCSFSIPQPLADLFIQKLQPQWLPQNEPEEPKIKKDFIDPLPVYSKKDSLPDEEFELGGEG